MKATSTFAAMTCSSARLPAVRRLASAALRVNAERRGRIAAMTARSSVPGAAVDGSRATQSPTAG